MSKRTVPLLFNKRTLEKIAPPEKGRATYMDSKTRGLILRVTTTGQKSFYLYRWIDGKPTRIYIGPFPDMTPEQARDRADELNGMIARGINPAEQKRAMRDELTFHQAFTEYMERHVRLHCRDGAKIQYHFDTYLCDLHAVKLSAVTPAKVAELNAKLAEERGKYNANRSMEVLRAIYNKMAQWGVYTGANPAKGIKPFREQKRERFLSANELPAFLQAVSEEANAHLRDFFMLALLCGARRANLQAMRWADIDLERTRPVQEGSKTVLQPDPVWRIPAEAAKAGEAITVPLVEAAEVILRRRKASANGSPWVFPSRGRTGHLVEVKSGWQRIVKAAGVSDLRLHDLRRTFAAWQLLGGGNVVSISKSLGHSSTQSTWVYARTHYNDVRQSVESGTSMMLSAGTAKRSRKGKRHAK